MNVAYDRDENIFIPATKLGHTGYIPYVIIKEPKLSRKLAAYYSIRQDLLDCLEYLEYCNSIRTDQDIPNYAKGAIQFTAIVRYARCFNESKGRRTSLHKDKVFEGQSDKIKESHKIVMDSRNQYLGHAGVSNHEGGAMFVTLTPKSVKKQILKRDFAGARLTNFATTLEAFIDLIQVVIDYVNIKIATLKTQWDKIIDEMDIDELYAKSKVPIERDIYKRANDGTIKALTT
jgi:hypothetical protein